MDIAPDQAEYQLQPSIEAEIVNIEQAARILVDHWGGNFVAKVEKLRNDLSSYILLQKRPTPEGVALCVGHARLEVAAFRMSAPDDPSVGSDAAVTSVIVLRDCRKRGLGTILMTKLIEKAADQQYGFIYLWTKDAQRFYQLLGFKICSKRLFSHKVVQSLDNAFLNNLGFLLGKKKAEISAETDAGNPEEDTWLRRRVTEFRPLTSISSSIIVDAWVEWAREQQEEVLDRLKSVTHILYIRCIDIGCSYKALPWAGQIGPSCGVAAVRIAAALLFNSDLATIRHDVIDFSDLGSTITENLSSVTAQGAPMSAECTGLLQYLLDSGRSDDGELYDIDNMAWLINSFFNADGIVAVVHPFGEMPDTNCINLEAIKNIYSADQAQGGACDEDCNNSSHNISFIIIPYDRDSAGDKPGLFGGLRAHFAIVVGVGFSIENSSAIGGSECTLVCLQGLSKRPVVAAYSAWVASNSQLFVKENEQGTHSVFSQTDSPLSIGYTSRINLNAKCIVMRKTSVQSGILLGTTCP